MMQWTTGGCGLRLRPPVVSLKLQFMGPVSACPWLAQDHSNRDPKIGVGPGPGSDPWANLLGPFSIPPEGLLINFESFLQFGAH